MKCVRSTLASDPTLQQLPMRTIAHLSTTDSSSSNSKLIESVLTADIPPVDAFKWMGVVMIGVSCIGVGGQYFPMWGGMFFPAKQGATEEEYYFAEYSSAEREQGLHMASSAFVSPAHNPVSCVLAPDCDCTFWHLIVTVHFGT